MALAEKGDRSVLFLLSAIAISAAAAAPRRALIVLPIGIGDARAFLCSESLSVSGEDRQHAGESKCHNAHYHPPLFPFRGHKSSSRSNGQANSGREQIDLNRDERPLIARRPCSTLANRFRAFFVRRQLVLAISFSPGGREIGAKAGSTSFSREQKSAGGPGGGQAGINYFNGLRNVSGRFHVFCTERWQLLDALPFVPRDHVRIACCTAWIAPIAGRHEALKVCPAILPKPCRPGMTKSVERHPMQPVPRNVPLPPALEPLRDLQAARDHPRVQHHLAKPSTAAPAEQAS